MSVYSKQKQEEYEAIMEQLSDIIDVVKFNKTLDQIGVRRYKLEDMIYKYVCYVPGYDPHLFDNVSMEEWHCFAEVVDFSECPTLIKYRELMNKLLKNFANLRSETLQGVYDNLHAELDRINSECPLVVDGTAKRLPYINWTPYYGGIISPQLKFGAKFRKWALQNGVSYYASPNQPVMTQEAEARYVAGYEQASQDVEQTLANEPEIDPANLL